MDLNLEGKKVFISGSTKGIGFETARLFLNEGAKVIINGRTNKSVQDALSNLNNDGVTGLVADFMDDSQVKTLIENIPNDFNEWIPQVRSSQKLSETLNDDYELALLFKLIATIDYDAPTFETVDDLRWSGPKQNYDAFLRSIDGERIIQRLESISVD